MHYLDNAATSWPKPDAVYTRMDAAFRQLFSPKRGTARAARLGASQLDDVRALVARILGADDPRRVCFMAGATHALNTAIQAFPLAAGDAVVMSAVEHHAVSRPVRKIARERGIRFHVVPYTDDTPFDLVAFEALLRDDPKIKLVATTHASNVLGSILPVAQIGALCRKFGKTYLLDAAQSAGVLPIDVESMGVDMVALPGHKSLYGPPGVGVLWIRDGVPLATYMEGGTGGDSGKHELAPTTPDGFEVGTIPLPQILALGEGIRWVFDTGLSTIHHHEIRLLSRLLDALATMPEVTIYGHRDVSRKTPVVSFNVAGFAPKPLGETLFDDFGIALRAGFHCAPMAHESAGSAASGGTVRASLGWSTTDADVDALVAALKSILASR